MADEDYQPAIVIDNGSGTIKAGIAGDEAPSSIFPSIVGYPKNVSQTAGSDDPGILIGAEAEAARDVLEIQYPISRGTVNNWDNLERLWQHAFVSGLQNDPAKLYVLFTEPPANSKKDREKMVTLAFETFSVRGTYIANTAAMALYASGRTTGLVLDSGDGVTHSVPVYDGLSVNNSVGKLDLGGVDLTGFVYDMLSKEGISLPTASDFETSRQIKEELCYVSPNIESEKGDDSGQYTLPDGQVISVGEARYRVPEALFSPDEGQGIHNLVFDSIMGSDINTRSQLYRNVVLAGGTTLFQGLASRFDSELRKLAPASTNIQVVVMPGRKYSPWIGGSIFAALSTFEEMAISAAEYNEVGPSIVQRKCF